MRRITGLVMLLVAALAILAPVTLPGASRSMAAQRGTAEAGSITVETLVRGLPADAAEGGLLLERITLAPGAALPNRTHPGSYAVFVLSGQLALTVVQGQATVTWASQTPGQLVGVGEVVVLRAGDSLFEQRAVEHHVVNRGAMPAVLLAASLLTDPGTPEPSWRPGQRP